MVNIIQLKVFMQNWLHFIKTLFHKPKITVLNNGTAKIIYTTVDNVVICVYKDKGYLYLHNSIETIFPLQMGHGNYEISLYKQINGKEYKRIYKSVVSDYSPENAVYLSSSDIVKYSFNSVWVSMLTQITTGINSNKDKINAVIEHITSRMTYDYAQSNTITAEQWYIPNADSVYIRQTGICSDYAVLLACMLRYLSIPCKVVFGYINKGASYHAWNEILVNGNWKTVDISRNNDNYADYIPDKYY